MSRPSPSTTVRPSRERGALFFQPTVAANAGAGMRVTREEIFGPVAPVYRLDTEDEAGIDETLIAAPEVPFGGVKESGLGKEGGHQGIEDNFETKYTCIGGL